MKKYLKEIKIIWNNIKMKIKKKQKFYSKYIYDNYI